MKFYTSISRLYRHIFPFNSAHLKFTKTYALDKADIRLLDVGCGVGDLSRAFAEEDWRVESIDNDNVMIQQAEKYTTDKCYAPSFQKMDMREIADNFQDNQFDIVSCYGNTLSHLLSDEDIESFICGASKLLKTHGVLLLQILNYNHVLDHKVLELPLIENTHIRFERTYTFRSDGLLDFNTMLHDKENNEILENCIPLNPIRLEDLQDILIDAGFEDIEVFGSFKKDSLTLNSLPLILKAVNRS